MPLMAMAIGAGVGLLKSETVDKNKEKRQRKLAAETQRLSPWTGMSAGPINEADPLGSMLAFGGTGAQMGAGIQQAGLNQKIAEQALAKGATSGGYQGGGSGAVMPPMMGAPGQNFSPAMEPGNQGAWWYDDPYGQNAWAGMRNYGG